MYGLAVFGIVVLVIIALIILVGFLLNLPDIFKYLKLKAM